MHVPPEILVLPDVAAVQQAAAERVLDAATARVAAAGRFSLALSGGNTPRGLYQILAQEPLRSKIPWSQIHVLWGDERYVPYDDPDSTYLMSRTALLDHVPIPADQIYPMPTSYADPQEAAQVYSGHVQALLDAGHGQIDLVLLGIGPDGHTASLFPHHPALDVADDALVVAVDGSPKPPPRRLTLTASALNRAALVMFLVAGADKAETVQRILRGPVQPRDLPAQLIHPPRGRVVWLLDEAAGRELDV